MSQTPEALETPFYQRHAQLLCYSFQQLLGRPLLPGHYFPENDPQLIQKLYSAPFALLSHGLEADPIFNFGNQRALELFEFSWLAFIQLPSRHSAEPINRDERAELLKKVTHQGYIDDYSGVRISSTGKRFIIEQAIVWNIVDELGQFHGQAAMFDQIKPL